jgi:hypothetical protein
MSGVASRHRGSSRLVPAQSFVSSVECAIQFRERIANVISRRRKLLLKDGHSRMSGRLHVVEECSKVVGSILKGGPLPSQRKRI